MTKYHNGPNGPGICRAKKGNCPFGGDEAHYDSLSEATKAHQEDCEKKYGILPGALDTTEIKVQGYNIHNIPLSSANFVKSRGKGTAYEREYFENKLKELDMNAEEIIKSLNEDDEIYGTWHIEEETESKITIGSEDTMGNKRFVDIKKVEKKEAPIRKISSYNSRNIPTALSNYVSLGSGGYKESEEYIKNIIENNKHDSKLLVDELNNNKRIFNKWEVSKEDDKTIKLKATDSLNNINYIDIAK